MAKLLTTSDEPYKNRIPKDMDPNYLNDVYKIVFGVELIEIYLERNIFEAKSLIISDFSKNGFFWAQIEEEAVNSNLKFSSSIALTF